MNGAIARIFIRYVVGLIVGANAASLMAGDPDIVTIVAALIGLATEVVYTVAKKRGWAL